MRCAGFVLGGIILCAGVVAQTKVVKKNAVKANNYGVTYSLPKTSLVVTAEVTQVTCKAGIYCQYAEKYLGVKEIISADKVYYELDKVWLKDVGIPDPELTYLIEFKPGTVAPYACLTEDGLLCAINTDYAFVPETTVSSKSSPKTGITEMISESVFTEELLMAGSIARQAEIAAKQIYRIRESRLDILTGEADNIPSDGEAMKITIAELEAREKALTNLFIGTSTQVTERFTLAVTPERELNGEVLFRFSPWFGVVDADDLRGAPVIMNLVITESPPSSEPKEMEKKLRGEKGLVYTIPGKASVEILLNGNSLYKDEVRIAQFGIQESLAPVLFEDKKNPVKIIFYPQTGSIKQIM
jgi:hypothetical protein